MKHATISQNAIGVGLCALIPLPFLDDLARRVLMGGAYQAIAEQAGHALQPEELRELTRHKGSIIVGCLVGVFLYPIRKILKKLLYVLSIKDALDWGAEAAIRGEMVRRAFDQGWLPRAPVEVRRAMDLAWKRHGASPVMGTILRRDCPEVEWEGGSTGGPVRHLVDRGGGKAVLEGFAAELLRLEDKALKQAQLAVEDEE